MRGCIKAETFSVSFTHAISGLGVIIFFFCFGCATTDKTDKVFDFLTEDFTGYGAAVNRDPLRLDRLLGLPREYYVFDENTPAEPAKGWLGIGLKEPEPPIREPGSDIILPAVEVGRIFPFSPAIAGGLLEKDIIVGLDGRRLTPGSKDSVLFNFRDMIASKGPGGKAALKILRGRPAVSGETAREIEITLMSKPKTPAKLKLHPRLEKKRGQHSDSLLGYLLKKENRVEEYKHAVRDIRNVTTDIDSLTIKGEDYNPFRLQEVNYVLHYPLDLPAVAHDLTSVLHERFNADVKDLSGLIGAGMEALDLKYHHPDLQGGGKPIDLAEYLECLIGAVERATQMRKEALSRLTAEELDILREGAAKTLKEDIEDGKKAKTEEEKRQADDDMALFFNTALKIDLSRLLNASALVAQAIDVETLLRLKSAGAKLNRFMNGWIVQEEPGLTTIHTAIGKVLIGGSGGNAYTEDAAIIIDLGGDDRYLNRGAGSTWGNPFPVIVDFSGNDIYIATEDFAQGAGILGGGFLIDLEGNDLYSAKNHAQGIGFFGVGLLVDLAGHDEYKADAVSQGAASFGVGILAEGGGNDRYAASRFAQGFGFVKGYGAIVEAAGNDEYFAGGKYPDSRDAEKSYGAFSQGFGLGLRAGDGFAGASGGIGIVADADGNDTYIGDYFSQGASYWYALGILADRKGHDKYIAGRYSQGAGIHLTAGILIDGEGDDEYVVSLGVSQGCGHDYAIGMLIDNGGNDRYVGGVISQGAGNDNGIGLLIDNGGNDEYYIKGMGQGRGNFNKSREKGSFGVHFDTGGGDDFYSAGGKNNRLIFKTQWGIFADTQ